MNYFRNGEPADAKREKEINESLQTLIMQSFGAGVLPDGEKLSDIITEAICLGVAFGSDQEMQAEYEEENGVAGFKGVVPSDCVDEDLFGAEEAEE